MRKALQAAESASPGDRRRRLLFASVGDRGCPDQWVSPDRTFDVWIAYYGREPGRYRDIADRYIECRDSKFPNLARVRELWRDDFNRYDAVFVPDDDVVIGPREIERIFDIRDELDAWVLHPAFDLRGKISYTITAWHPWCRYRYVDTVDMTAPLFRRDKLEAFLEVFDPRLKGWGTDLWFLEVIGDESLRRRIVLCDEVTCLNPHDWEKPGDFREIDGFQSRETRRRRWAVLARRHGIPAFRPRPRTHAAVRLPAGAAVAASLRGFRLLPGRIGGIGRTVWRRWWARIVSATKWHGRAPLRAPSPLPIRSTGGGRSRSIAGGEGDVPPLDV